MKKECGVSKTKKTDRRRFFWGSMKLFELKTDLTSYKYPIVKIGICISIILLLIFDGCPLGTQYLWMKILTKIISFLLCCGSILCIYISVGELFYTHKNRKAKIAANIFPANLKRFNIREIVQLIRQNDIIEIAVFVNEKTVKVGASSDCKFSDSVFFDKRYYIDDTEYNTFDAFQTAFFNCMQSEEISVLSIDGVKP